MRIAMLTSAAFPPREGMGVYIWNLSRFLVRQGHTVHIITRGNARLCPPETVDGITIWRPVFYPVYPFHVHFHSLFVNRLISDLAPVLDIIHLHTPLVRFPRTSLPTLVTVHTPMKAETAAIPATNLTGVLVKLQTQVSITLEQELFCRTDRIVAVASSVAQELTAYQVDRDAIGVVGNGVDDEFFTPLHVGQATSTPYFFTAGRLGPRKGMEDLIACAEVLARQIPSIRFLIAGVGPFEKSLRSLIGRRGLAKTVILLGHISDRSAMVDLYRGALGYIHPAHYEGLPTVVLEAMACGCPVVATAVSGALDVIRDGYNGLLVPARAPDRLAAAATCLLADSALRKRLSAAALQTIHQRYAWSVVSRNYLTLYESLLVGKQHCR
jgi:glycosyltransferase involved in cell wall biosynthesis